MRQKEAPMVSLNGKKTVVIGGSRWVGRRIIGTGKRNGALVVEVAREPVALQRLKQEIVGVETPCLRAREDCPHPAESTIRR